MCVCAQCTGSDCICALSAHIVTIYVHLVLSGMGVHSVVT